MNSVSKISQMNKHFPQFLLIRAHGGRLGPSKGLTGIVIMLSTEELDPSTVREAQSSPNSTKWKEAMEREMKSLHSNKVWELVEPPPDRRSKWIFKRKVDANGAVERYKARLVAQGCTQRYGLDYEDTFGLDYEDTFSPVVRFESVRTVVALGVQHQFHLHQIDLSTAFLHLYKTT